MGTWGTGSFENDDAADFLITFEDRGVDLLIEAFERTRGADYLEWPDAACAVAAAEIIAFAGDPSGAEAETLKPIELHSAEIANARGELIASALAALERIMGEESEMKEQWREAGEDYAEWSQRIHDLSGRLRK